MSKKTAIYLMFTILTVVLVFHILIFTEQIPYDKVWAGRLNSLDEMKAFETYSILLNVFIYVILFIKYKLLEKEKSNKVIDILIWIFVVLFSLNSIGNLFAENIIELILGTLLTVTSAFLCFIIVRNKKTV